MKITDPSSLVDPRHLQVVLQAVAVERARQDDKWGPYQRHDYGTWKAILGEEEGEADREFLRLKFTERQRGEDFRKELVEVAAVVCAMIECGDREGWFAPRAEVYQPGQQTTGDEVV